MKIDLVVTKNPSFLSYLIFAGIVSPTVEYLDHATPTDVICKHVIGDLPHGLSCITLSYTEVPLHLPRELVGQRLLTADYEKYAGEPITYLVNCLPKFVELELPNKEALWKKEEA